MPFINAFTAEIINEFLGLGRSIGTYGTDLISSIWRMRRLAFQRLNSNSGSLSELR